MENHLTIRMTNTVQSYVELLNMMYGTPNCRLLLTPA
jgi:hypothetical protein